MKGLKLPGEIESKDEKSQIYLENNLNKIKNNFPDMINIKGFLSILLIKKKTIDYEILSSEVGDINFYDRYNTLYNCLNYLSNFSAEEISIKNKSFLEDLSKGFKLKSVYTTKGENNIEKTYDDLVFNNKKLMMFFIKK